MSAFGSSAPPFRILVSERSEWFRDLLAGLVLNFSANPVSLATLVPPTILEKDLFAMAERQKFDLAVFLLNNISYSSRNPNQIEEDSIALVETMACRFRRPIIAVYGSSKSGDYQSHLLKAGANKALSTPWDNKAMQQALLEGLILSIMTR